MFVFLRVACIYLFSLHLTAASPLDTEYKAEHTKKQKEEWEKLYPKLNSKMARMEELLNYVDRFLGNDEFKNEVLLKIAEFIYHTESSQKHIPAYLLKKDKAPFTKALQTTAKTGKDLYLAVAKENQTEAKSLYLKLDKLRRKSHSKWAE